MKRDSLRNSRVAPIILGALLYGLAGTVSAARDCWVDIYELPDFGGKTARIEGPVELRDLTQIKGQDWSGRVDAIKTGPKAEVILDKHENFWTRPTTPLYHGDAIQHWRSKDENYFEDHFTLAPGDSVHHLGEVHFHDQVRSLKIVCK